MLFVYSLIFFLNNAIGKNTKNNNELPKESLYCRNCSPKYEPKYKGKDDTSLDYEAKKIICIDCGDEFYLDNPMANRTYRCKNCQNEANKQAKRDWWNRNNNSN